MINKIYIIVSLLLLHSVALLAESENAYLLDTLSGKRFKDKVELKEVVVSQRRVGTIKSRTTLLDVQKINGAELCRAACCNLGESFETNASVDVTYSDAATGARQIKLLGLAGKYVQMQTENIPNLRGLASTFGLGYIPGTWMNAISISKGTSSVKTGFEAMTGQIDVEYKKPQSSDVFSTNLYGSTDTKYEINVDGSWRISPKWSTMLFAHYEDMVLSHDGNGDGFMDMPMVRQINVLNRWAYTSDDFVSQFGLKVINESRHSGQIQDSASLGYTPYHINIATTRVELFAKNGWIYNHETGGSVALIANGVYHDQNSQYGPFTSYQARQVSGYANLIWEDRFEEAHHVSAGLSMQYDGYREALRGMQWSSDEYTPGLYAQYTYTLDERFSILAGVRGDLRLYEIGQQRVDPIFFVTPRVHIKYAPLQELQLRMTAGRGFRTPQIWSENSSILASNREMVILGDYSHIDQKDRWTPELNQRAMGQIKPEESWNFGLSASAFIPIKDKTLNINLEAYLTLFQNQVVSDMDADPHKLLIYNLNGSSFAANYQIELSYPFFTGFTATAAFRYSDVRTTYNGVLRIKPLQNPYKGLITLSYQTPLKTWQFDLTTQFNGGGRMPDAPILADGTPAWQTNLPFWVNMHAQVTRYFRHWSIYIGGENLLNYKQSSPIISADNPYCHSFDGSMVWGPVSGVMGYIGVRYNLPYPEKKDI